MDQSLCKHSISELHRLKCTLESENFAGFYQLYPTLKQSLALLRDLESHGSMTRFALCYIHDAFAYNPSYQLTPKQVDAIRECLVSVLVLSHCGINAENLDSIRAHIESVGLYLLPIGKSPIDRVGTEETKESVLADLNAIEKRLASILDIQIDSLHDELVRRLKSDELGEYEHSGLPAAWLELRSAAHDWEEEDNEAERTS